MKNLFDLVNSYGFHLDESAPTVVKLSLYFLILSLMVLFNVINIGIYLLTIYIVSHEKFLSKIPAKYVYVHKFLIFYKSIRIKFIIIEFIFLLICLGIMITMSYSLVSFFIHYK